MAFPVWDGPMPMRVWHRRLQRSDEEARLSKIAGKLQAMAAECCALDAVAEAQLRKRAEHWRSKAWVCRGGGQRWTGTVTLPSELVLRIAEAYCTPDGLLTISAVSHGWYSALMMSWDRLWRQAATARFPRVTALAAAEGTAKSWREIYRCQLACDATNYHERREPADGSPQPKASDFVLTFTLTAPVTDRVMIDETHRLPDPGVGSALASAKLWESTPGWLTEWWEGGMNRDEWEDQGEQPRLSLWISRGMKTAQIFEDVRLKDFDNESRTLSFGPGFLDNGYYRCHAGFVSVEFQLDGRLGFRFSSLDNRQLRTDDDSILRGFDTLLSNIRPTASDLSKD